METDALTSNAVSKASALPPATGSSRINLGTSERIVSLIAGVALSVIGARNFRTRRGKTMTLAGGYLLSRGVTGYCALNNIVGRNTATRKAPAMEVKGTFTINKPRNEVFAFWRNLENLPRFMKHLEEVRVIDERRSAWKARIPGGVGTVSWEATLESEETNSHLSWCSLPGSTIDNAGEVTFTDAPGNQGTEIRACVSYRLPAGQVGSIAGKLFNPVVEQLLKEDLKRFKQIMETGEIPSTEGQPSGRSGEKQGSGQSDSARGQEGQRYESPVLDRH